MQKEVSPTMVTLVSGLQICSSCLALFNTKFYTRKVAGVEVVSLYEYDEFFRGLLYQYKGKGDIELAPVFIANFSNYLRLKYYKYLIVYAPSSKSSDLERGFNHVFLAFEPLKLKQGARLEKTSDFKQSELNFEERQKVGNHLRLLEGDRLIGRKVLIVDDLYTTGATVRAIISLVKTYHPTKIRVLTLSYTKTRDDGDWNVHNHIDK